MKKLILVIAMLAAVVFVNGCSEEEQKGLEGSELVSEAQVETTEAAVEESAPVVEEPAPVEAVPAVEEAKEAAKEVKSACSGDCTCPTCQKKTACPADCDKPCCAKEATSDTKAVCSKTCDKKEAGACPKDCQKDCCVTVVTVNGQKITEKRVSEEVSKRLEAQKKRMPAGMEMPDSMMTRVRTQVIDMEVDQTLVEQEIAKHDLVVSEEQIIAKITELGAQKGQSLEEIEKEIANFGMTMEDLKAQIGLQLKIEKLMELKNPEDRVTQEDAKKFYDENPQHFVTKEQVKASHILCGKRGITEDQYPAELTKIEAAKARLDAGEAFEDVAKDVSTCPSSAQGGDLGFFGKGQMDPAFEKVAFELETGQRSDIVKTSFGYHIIKVTDKTAGGTKSFEDEEETITQYLTQQNQREFWTGYQKTMRDNAVIEYSEKEQAARDEAEKAAAEAAAARAARQAAPKPIQPAPAPKPETTEEK